MFFAISLKKSLINKENIFELDGFDEFLKSKLNSKRTDLSLDIGRQMFKMEKVLSLLFLQLPLNFKRGIELDIFLIKYVFKSKIYFLFSSK